MQKKIGIGSLKQRLCYGICRCGVSVKLSFVALSFQPGEKREDGVDFNVVLSNYAKEDGKSLYETILLRNPCR